MTRTPIRLLLPFLLLGASASGGCGSQAATTYEGEPLAVVRGSVQPTSVGAPSAPIEAAILWHKVTLIEGGWQEEQGSIATRTPVEGSFPAEFTLRILTPPDASVLVPCFPDDPSRSGGLAWGRVVAVGVETDPSNVRRSNLYGFSDAFIVYADAAVPADAPCNRFEAPIGPGYHMFVWREMSAEEKAYLAPGHPWTEEFRKCLQETTMKGESTVQCEREPWGPDYVEAPEGFDRRITLAVHPEPFKELPPPRPAGDEPEPEPEPPPAPEPPPPGPDAG